MNTTTHPNEQVAQVTVFASNFLEPSNATFDEMLRYAKAAKQDRHLM